MKSQPSLKTSNQLRMEEEYWLSPVGRGHVAFVVLGTVLNTHMYLSQTPVETISGPHLLNERTEAQGSEGVCPRSLHWCLDE